MRYIRGSGVTCCTFAMAIITRVLDDVVRSGRILAALTRDVTSLDSRPRGEVRGPLTVGDAAVSRSQSRAPQRSSSSNSRRGTGRRRQHIAGREQAWRVVDPWGPDPWYV